MKGNHINTETKRDAEESIRKVRDIIKKSKEELSRCD